MLEKKIQQQEQKNKNKLKKSYTLNKHINCCWGFTIFSFQAYVETLILSSFIDSWIDDCEPFAEQSWSAAVTDRVTSAYSRCGPPQILPTSAGEETRELYCTCYMTESVNLASDGEQWTTFL